MSAKLNNVRKGDRAEYISQAIFSALGYSVQILRQEDYGIDFLCTLTQKSDIVSYPSESFTVQLKTNQNNIVYNVSDKQKAKWLLDNNLPFFICFFDNSKNTVSFFSTSLLNHYIITQPKGVTKISFRQQNEIGKSLVHLGTHKKTLKIFKIDLGKAFLTISLNDLNKEEKIEDKKNILDKVIRKEIQNITNRNLKIPFMNWVHSYTTNKPNITFGWADFSDDKLIKASELLSNIGHIVMSLCNTYKIESDSESFESLRKIILKLPFNNEYKTSLINMGFRDKYGEEITVK